MNKDKIKQLRALARCIENILEDLPQSHIRCVKESMKALDDVADYYDDPVKLIKQRFDNPNIDVRLEGKDLVFRPDFTIRTDGTKCFRWGLTEIQDYIRGYHFVAVDCMNDVICYTTIDYDWVVVDFENKEIRIDADYYVSLL